MKRHGKCYSCQTTGETIYSQTMAEWLCVECYKTFLDQMING
ncbi:hypothetical protein PK21_gp73 [Geobacillus phage vB_GthS_PK2.1]|nr:hypothetical protein PK21_gp73 [Geobacillus phage vB_GthS_PK2.1]